MQLALRRGYGYAFDPRRGMRGLGATCGDGTADGEALCFDVTTNPGPSLPTLTDSPVFLPQVTLPTVPYDTAPIGTTLSPGMCPDGSAPFSDGSCTETAAPSGSAGSIAAAAQVAAALTKAIAPVMSASGVPGCPAGYAYGAAGQSVQIAPGVATVGAGKCLPVSGGAPTGQLISGISNSTLGIVAVGFVVLMMFSSGGGRRR